MKNSEVKDFVAYEYLSINVIGEKESLYTDCYENFGWVLTNSINNGLVDEEDYYINNLDVNDYRVITLKFKRDRKIPNKAKVIALQKKCENGLKELERLEKEPHVKGAFLASTMAVIGAIFLVGLLFVLNISKFLAIVLGIIGLLCWILSYPVYRKIRSKQEFVNSSLIEEQYNMIYDSCSQAQKLLN